MHNSWPGIILYIIIVEAYFIAWPLSFSNFCFEKMEKLGDGAWPI